MVNVSQGKRWNIRADLRLMKVGIIVPDVSDASL